MPYKLLFESNTLSGRDELSKLIAKLLLIGYDIIRSELVGGDPNTLMRLNIDRIYKLGRFLETPQGYYLAGYPKGYHPTELPHANTLEGARSYCIEHHCGGVTYQYGRYEVRQGPYLMDQKKDSLLKSWVYR